MPSSSLWGCELKCKNGRYGTPSNCVILLVRMWVEIQRRTGSDRSRCVILLVRMWVEILPCRLCKYPHWSSSLWGCELKFWTVTGFPIIVTVILLVRMWVEMFYDGGLAGCRLVILLVRMWVEMYLQSCCSQMLGSSSLWGCELKWKMSLNGRVIPQRHPPCEDVSWNNKYTAVLNVEELVILLVRMWVEIIRFSIEI